ncbi:hypothetical protein IHE31_03715 [Mycetohabitans rhizoxinica]|uniref:hypothetical protein n=1 Tax=Mycetohabitans rhizoxinica TaxID=412963 RepID=UPI0030D2B02C
MRKAGLRTREKRKFAATIDSRHTLLVTENVLDRQFDRGEPNRAWLGQHHVVCSMSRKENG